jgi:hypothetical protein
MARVSKPTEPQGGQGEEPVDIDQLALKVDALRERNGELQEQLERLTTSLGTVWGLESIGNGLADIIDELQPLRYLIPPQVGEKLPPATIRALMNLRRSLARPDWTNVTSLGVVEPDVGYIGTAEQSDSSTIVQAPHGMGVAS